VTCIFFQRCKIYILLSCLKLAENVNKVYIDIHDCFFVAKFWKIIERKIHNNLWNKIIFKKLFLKWQGMKSSISKSNIKIKYIRRQSNKDAREIDKKKKNDE